MTLDEIVDKAINDARVQTFPAVAESGLRWTARRAAVLALEEAAKEADAVERGFTNESWDLYRNKGKINLSREYVYKAEGAVSAAVAIRALIPGGEA